MVAHSRERGRVRHTPSLDSLGHHFRNGAANGVVPRVFPLEQVVDSPYDQPKDTVAFAPSPEHRKVADETPNACPCIIIPDTSGCFTVSFATVPLE